MLSLKDFLKIRKWFFLGFEFCYRLSFRVLSQFEFLSFITIGAFWVLLLSDFFWLGCYLNFEHFFLSISQFLSFVTISVWKELSTLDLFSFATYEIFNFHNTSFWVLPCFEFLSCYTWIFSFVTFNFFNFCHNLDFWVFRFVTIWVFSSYNLSLLTIWVLFQFKFFNCVYFFEIRHILSFVNFFFLIFPPFEFFNFVTIWVLEIFYSVCLTFVIIYVLFSLNCHINLISN